MRTLQPLTPELFGQVAQFVRNRFATKAAARVKHLPPDLFDTGLDPMPVGLDGRRFGKAFLFPESDRYRVYFYRPPSGSTSKPAWFDCGLMAVDAHR